MSGPCRSAIAAVCAVLLLAGCGVSRPTVEPDHGVKPVAHDGAQDTETAHLSTRSNLLRTVEEWRGTPYRYGGDNQRGIDCSGFTSRVVAEVFNVQLPRTTRAQMKYGSRVDRSHLAMGDLVFFRTPSRTDHVGVYIGEGEFAHSSSSSGVMISHLDEPYWAGSYREARRVLPAALPRTAVPEDKDQIAPSPRPELVEMAAPPRRVGW